MALAGKKSGKLSVVKVYSQSKSGHLDSSHYFKDLESQGLGRRFLDKLHQNKDKIHQVDATSGLTETNGSVRSRSIQVAMAMYGRGVHENDIVLICSRAHSDQTVVVLAILLLGAIVAPLDPQLSLAEFKSLVLELKPKMAFCDARVYGQLESTIRESPEASQCQVVIFGDRSDRLGFEKILQEKSDPNFQAVIIKEPRRRVAFIVASQNTSGPPKLICISHYAMLIQVTYCANKILQNTQKILSYFPLAWITQVAIVCFSFEVPVIRILPGSFSERTACRIIHDLRVDCAVLGTDYAIKIVHHGSYQDFDLSCLKTIYVGGAVTSALDMSFLRKSFQGVSVFQCYGLTEMSGLVSGFPNDQYQIALKKLGSVGPPVAGVKTKIVEFDSRETLGPDWWGELLVSGPTMMLGYYKDILGTNASLEKGYFKTGDVAQCDSEGCLYIQGRMSDHILQKGLRIFPNTLEEVIMTHPCVFEVAVVGDDKELVACVVRNPQRSLTTDQLMQYISEKVPEDKLPTKIKFLDSFPKTTVGKVKRHLLRQSVLGVTIEHSKSIVSIESKSV